MSLLQQCRWKTNPIAPPLYWDGSFTRTGMLIGAQEKTVFLTMHPSTNCTKAIVGPTFLTDTTNVTYIYKPFLKLPSPLYNIVNKLHSSHVPL